MIISKKLSKSGDEVDVLVLNKELIVECKRVHGSNFQNAEDRLNDIVLKFLKEEKLSSEIKSKYPNHFGQLQIDNPANPYYNVEKEGFIKTLKEGFSGNEPIVGTGTGQIDPNDLQKIQEISVTNGRDSFVIFASDWIR